MSKHNVSTAASLIRNEIGLTQKELGDKLGISVVQLSRIENGHAMPSYDMLNRYEDITGINPYILQHSLKYKKEVRT